MFKANDNLVNMEAIPMIIKEIFGMTNLIITKYEDLDKADVEELGINELVMFILTFKQTAPARKVEGEESGKVDTREEGKGETEGAKKKTSFKELPGEENKIDFDTFYNGMESYIINSPTVVVLEKREEGAEESYGPTEQQNQQHPYPNKVADYDMIKHNQHFYDAIETEEYIMPNIFEVEIHLADNQVEFF